mgnify:CR=1 FL=1
MSEIMTAVEALKQGAYYFFEKPIFNKLEQFLAIIRSDSVSEATRLNVLNDYTYTLETIIQAGQKNMAWSS